MVGYRRTRFVSSPSVVPVNTVGRWLIGSLVHATRHACARRYLWSIVSSAAQTTSERANGWAAGVAQVMAKLTPAGRVPSSSLKTMHELCVSSACGCAVQLSRSVRKSS